MAVLDELERIQWDKRHWDLSLQTKNPMETYAEFFSATEREPDVPIDDLPNKDWLRAT